MLISQSGAGCWLEIEALLRLAYSMKVHVVLFSLGQLDLSTLFEELEAEGLRTVLVPSPLEVGAVVSPGAELSSMSAPARLDPDR
jgi:beta-galactosidase GanA